MDLNEYGIWFHCELRILLRIVQLVQVPCRNRHIAYYLKIINLLLNELHDTFYLKKRFFVN